MTVHHRSEIAHATIEDPDPGQHVSGALARFLRTQPVLAAMLVIELPIIGGLLKDLLDGGSLTVAGVGLAIATPLVPLVMAGVRQAVTPTARPQLVAGGETIPLVPHGVDEHHAA